MSDEPKQIQQSFLNKARKDKFILVLGLPKAFLRLYPETKIRELQISVYGSPVPAINIPSKEVNFMGQQLKVTGEARSPYGPLNVNFSVDNEFRNYWILWKWLDIINNSEESRMDTYFENYETINQRVINKNSNNMPIYFDYMTDMTIYGMDEYNNRKIEFTYKKAFITGLGEISYNYRDPSEMESSVSFEFSQLHSKLLKS